MGIHDQSPVWVKRWNLSGHSSSTVVSALRIQICSNPTEILGNILSIPVPQKTLGEGRKLHLV